MGNTSLLQAGGLEMMSEDKGPDSGLALVSLQRDHLTSLEWLLIYTGANVIGTTAIGNIGGVAGVYR